MISITSIESAINFWRAKSPSDATTCAVCPEVNALADVYALMIVQRLAEIPTEQLTAAQKEALDRGLTGGAHA